MSELYLKGEKIIVQEVSVLSEDCSEAEFCELDVLDEKSGIWWGIYR